jgi:hypothetical protein
VIIPLDFKPQTKTEIEVAERSPTVQDVQLLTDVGHDALELYLGGPAVDEVAGPVLRKALELRDRIGVIDTDIGRFSSERDEVSAAMYEVQNNLYAIEGIGRAGELRTRLTQRLTELQKRYDGLQTKIIDLTAQRGEMVVEMSEALRDVDLEVPEPPATPPPAAPATSGAPAAEPAPAAPAAPAAPPAPPPAAPAA